MIRCSVAIPVHNQRAFIARAVQSALAQEVEGLEILAVDNCSDDGTWEALQPFAARGVQLHRNPANIGLFGNFNRSLDLARGPFLRFLSGDDALAPGCLRKEIEIMERNSTLAMLSTRGRFVTPEGTPIGVFAADLRPGVYEGGEFPQTWFHYYTRTRRNPLNYPSGVLFRRSAIGDARFEEGWRTAGDIDFYFKVLRRGELGIADIHGCDVTRHAEQAHVGPNLDGTAMREQLALLDRYADATERKLLQERFAGMCLALAAMHGGASAAAHWRIAREIASLPAALRALAALIAGRAFAQAPVPSRALA